MVWIFSLKVATIFWNSPIPHPHSTIYPWEQGSARVYGSSLEQMTFGNIFNKTWKFYSSKEPHQNHNVKNLWDEKAYTERPTLKNLYSPLDNWQCTTTDMNQPFSCKICYPNFFSVDKEHKLRYKMFSCNLEFPNSNFSMRNGLIWLTFLRSITTLMHYKQKYSNLKSQ